MQNRGIPGEYHQVSKWWSPFENGANLGQSTLIFAWAVAPRSNPCPCLHNCLKRLHRLLFPCHGTTGSGTAPLAKIERSGRWQGFHYLLSWWDALPLSQFWWSPCSNV